MSSAQSASENPKQVSEQSDLFLPTTNSRPTFALPLRYLKILVTATKCCLQGSDENPAAIHASYAMSCLVLVLRSTRFSTADLYL